MRSSMTQSLAKPATYSAALDALRRGRGQSAPPWLAALADHAWSRFTQLGLPTARRGNEKWKYTNVAPIARAAFGYAWDLDPDEDPDAGRLRHFGLLDESWINLVFVDGRFSTALSSRPPDSQRRQRHHPCRGRKPPWGYGAAPLGRVRQLPRRRLHRPSTPPSCPTALSVHVSRGDSSGPPVHLVFPYHQPRASPRRHTPRTLIVVEEDAALSVVETYAGPSNEQYFTNAVTEIYVGDGSRVQHHRLSLEGADSYHVGLRAGTAGTRQFLFLRSPCPWATPWAATTSRF